MCGENYMHMYVCIYMHAHRCLNSMYVHIHRVSPKVCTRALPPPFILCSVTTIFVRIKIYNIIVLSVKAILIIIHQNIHSDSPPPLFFFLRETLYTHSLDRCT